MATEAFQKQSPEAVERLKQNWLADGCWDLEDTEGFEAHRDELLAFSDAAKARSKADEHAKVEKQAEALGCPGNLRLARYVLSLEHRLERITERLEILETGSRRN